MPTEIITKRGVSDKPLFSAIAQHVYAIHKEALVNEKNRQSWLRPIEMYAYPFIRYMPIDQVRSSDVLQILEAIWFIKPETARKVLQRLRAIFDYAKALGYYIGDNPVTMALIGLPRMRLNQKHFAALPHADVAAFIVRLRQEGGKEVTRLGFEWLILTATRTSETLNASWHEIDMDQKSWTIPPERIKTRQEHRVPLSSRCMAILERLQKLDFPCEYLFPNLKRDGSLSTMAFLMCLRRMEVPVTAHGFRSSFRDWASEETGYPYAVCEAALAHSINNSAAAAYARSDLFKKRIPLMEEWAQYIS